MLRRVFLPVASLTLLIAGGCGFQGGNDEGLFRPRASITFSTQGSSASVPKTNFGPGEDVSWDLRITNIDPSRIPNTAVCRVYREKGPNEPTREADYSRYYKENGGQFDLQEQADVVQDGDEKSLMHLNWRTPSPDATTEVGDAPQHVSSFAQAIFKGPRDKYIVEVSLTLQNPTEVVVASQPLYTTEVIEYRVNIAGPESVCPGQTNVAYNVTYDKILNGGSAESQVFGDVSDIDWTASALWGTPTKSLSTDKRILTISYAKAPLKMIEYSFVAALKNTSRTGTKSTKVESSYVNISTPSAEVPTVCRKGSLNFGASVVCTTGTDSDVAWAVLDRDGNAGGSASDIGSIDQNGLYTAPDKATIVTIRATSKHVRGSDGLNIKGFKRVEVKTISISLNPNQDSTCPLQTVTFSPIVTCDGSSSGINQSLVWQVVDQNGNPITTGGSMVGNVYTAPAVTGAFYVRATSSTYAGVSATTRIEVKNVSIALNPNQDWTCPLKTVTFSPVVSCNGSTNGINQAVTWAVVDQNGNDISSGGSMSGNIYTAPAVAGAYYVRATSTAYPGVSASTRIQTKPLVITISPSNPSTPAGEANLTLSAAVSCNGVTLTGSDAAVSWSKVSLTGASTINSATGLITAGPIAESVVFRATSVLASNYSSDINVAVGALKVAIQNGSSVPIEGGIILAPGQTSSKFKSVVTEAATGAGVSSFAAFTTTGGAVAARSGDSPFFEYTAPATPSTYKITATTPGGYLASIDAVVVPFGSVVVYDERNSLRQDRWYRDYTTYISPSRSRDFGAQVLGPLGGTIEFRILSGGGSVNASTGVFSSPASISDTVILAYSVTNPSVQARITVLTRTGNGGADIGIR